MDDLSIFERERKTVRHAMELLASHVVPLHEWPAHYETLLQEYTKLLRQSERLVRISDMMHHQLNTLNAQLDHHRRVAEQANNAKGQFLAMMSHDIRNPLAAVAVMTDLLMQTDLSGEQREYLDDIKSASNALLTLLDEVLDLSRIEAGKMDLACEDFGLWECIGDAVRTSAITASAKPVELVSYLDREVPFRVIGDCGRLGQILMNLLSNAVKFTERGEIVTRAEVLSHEDDAVTVHFSVSDTGIGIAADRLDSVFHEFEQAHRGIMAKYGGSGLGLAICAKLVAGMRGEIWAESEVGKGSTFHFSARLAVAPEWTGGPQPSNFSGLKGLRVLVVSHIPICRSVLEEFLKNWDMEAASAATGAAALDLVREAYAQDRSFGAILIDSAMPEMTDLAFARQVLRDSGLGDAQIILLTTSGSLGQSAAALGMGIVHRIPKPPKLLDLLTAMSRLLEAPEPETDSLPGESDHKTEDRLHTLRILVAEDNPINRILAIRMLQKMGQTVSAVEDGEAVLRALDENDFDLILMDVEMPLKNGVETTKAIREREALTGKHIAIIAMTAHVMEEDRARFLEGGMDGYVSKPIDWKQLLKTMQRIA
jgi:two-component system, sensor histidine kinase and response regulator